MNQSFKTPMASDLSSIRRVGYLGPEGTWTHQATLDIFEDSAELVPFANGLFEAYEQGEIDAICAPATTSLVGTTPYLDRMIELTAAKIVAEYPKILGYSLLASPDATFESITKVLAHPVALEEVGPWLDRHMPTAEREARAGATSYVAQAKSPFIGALGPSLGAHVFGLRELRSGIEEGFHNVTRWWVLGRETPPPSGDDRTTLHFQVNEQHFGDMLTEFIRHGVTVLNIYERPTRRRLDEHHYIVDVAGHVAADAKLRKLAADGRLRVLGSYRRAY